MVNSMVMIDDFKESLYEKIQLRVFFILAACIAKGLEIVVSYVMNMFSENKGGLISPSTVVNLDIPHRCKGWGSNWYP